MPAASSIQCCERTAIALSANGKSWISPGRAHDRANCLFVWSEGLQPPHQYIEKAFAGRLFSHIHVAAREDCAIDFLYVRGKNGKRRPNSARQLRKLESGLAGDLRKADLFEGVFRQAAP